MLTILKKIVLLILLMWVLFSCSSKNEQDIITQDNFNSIKAEKNISVWWEAKQASKTEDKVTNSSGHSLPEWLNINN
jgi:hypothetical protein